MAKQLKKGDKVQWATSQGKTTGTVKKKITSPMKIKGHKVAASKSNPEYLVESAKSGDKAAHKAEALKKVSKSGSTAKKSSKSGTAKKSTKSASAKKSSSSSTGTKKKISSGSTAKKSASSKPGTATKTPTKSASEKGKSKEDEKVIAEFKKMMNISPKELDRWLDTKESKKVGFKENGKGESVGHESGKKILKILAKRKDRYTDEDVKNIHKVVGYVKRHLAQKPKGDISASNWRYSLMNWGHDPAK